MAFIEILFPRTCKVYYDSLLFLSTNLCIHDSDTEHGAARDCYNNSNLSIALARIEASCSRPEYPEQLREPENKKFGRMRRSCYRDMV